MTHVSDNSPTKSRSWAPRHYQAARDPIFYALTELKTKRVTKDVSPAFSHANPRLHIFRDKYLACYPVINQLFFNNPHFNWRPVSPHQRQYFE